LERILVSYDSGYGWTEVVAETIAETLTEKGMKVDLRLVGLEDISEYDAVLVGSPIRLGRCTPRMKKFLKRNLASLTSMQVAFLFNGMQVLNL
jgi:menaquinone-dependent protoporphyrinogen oxidase